MKTVHRYTLRAEIAGEIEYDPAKPESYTAALSKVAEQREMLKNAGATITHDAGKPVTIRGNAP